MPIAGNELSFDVEIVLIRIVSHDYIFTEGSPFAASEDGMIDRWKIPSIRRVVETMEEEILLSSETSVNAHLAGAVACFEYGCWEHSAIQGGQSGERKSKEKRLIAL